MPELRKMAHRHPRGAVIRNARLYDALAGVATLGRDRRLREAILEIAGLSSGERVLDVGCGTGTLAIDVKRQVGREGVVQGIDASEEMIALARKKADSRGVGADFQVAAAQDVPFADATFDVVLCTMVMHHLPRDQREAAIAEMFRVLVPGGRVLIVDLSREGNRLARLNPIALVHGKESLDTTRQVEDLVRKQGFADVAMGALGVLNLGYVRGRKPAAA